MAANSAAVAALRALLLVLVMAGALSPAAALERLDGFNIVAVPGHPFGGASAERAMRGAKRIGARALAIVPFLWQAQPQSGTIARGNDMSDSALRSAIRQTHALGLAAIVKPQVWVPQSWAGAVAPASEDDWRTWFAAYGASLAHIARVAAEEKAEALVIGTELLRTRQRPEWVPLIGAIRAIYPGTLFYVAHNPEEAEQISFWPLLDAIGVSLYPALGTDEDRAARLKSMRDAAARLDTLALRFDKPVIVGEIGLRSARGASAKPWQSAEERVATADPLLQAAVLADWLAVLDRPSVRGVLIWRWLSDPQAGGLADTDFTVQGKPAEGVLLCAWTVGCKKM
jgi:hypothetical protein